MISYFMMAVIFSLFAFSFLHIGIELLSFRYYHTGQSNKGNQVWNSHETVYNIRQSPDDFQLEEGCGRNEEDENNAIWKNSLCACQVGHAAFTIVVPSQDGREPMGFPFRRKSL